MKRFKIGLMSILLTGILGACASNHHSSHEKSVKDKLSVITTFYPMYDFTRNIMGDEGNVELLIPAGTEPHDYEPSAKEIAKIHDADVFIYHNENMETWVPRVAESWPTGNPNVIKGTKDMILLPGNEEEEHDHGDGEEEHHHELDPHTWVSPKMAIKEVSSIKDQLIKLYPDKKKVFETNAEKYLTKLKKLDENYTSSFRNAKQKYFVTQHAAFGYLALDYGLKQVPIAGLSPEEEPSPSRLAELKKYVQKNGIQYIYFEQNAGDKIARTLATEAKVKLEVLNPVESLTQEQMANGEDYLSVMKDNLKALEKTTNVSGKEINQEKETNTEKTIMNGYFEDNAVKDRSLSDYAGEWQSVYPLLKNGSLDQVFEYKAKMNKDKTAQEYKYYYAAGYASDVEKLTITDHTIDFIVNGKHHKYDYKYVGYKILNYEKGNRGVRFMFETDAKDAGQFKFVQFSDHNIAPVKAAHFHIFYGEKNQQQLFNELVNWPTFYPSNLSSQEVAQEMMAH